jgi:iron complex transport system permease protein
VLVLNSAVGPVTIPPGTVVRLLLARAGLAGVPAGIPATFSTILFDIRLPHTALLGLAGLALGVSGAAYQGLFRNPLADPTSWRGAGAGLGRSRP